MKVFDVSCHAINAKVCRVFAESPFDRKSLFFLQTKTAFESNLINAENMGIVFGSLLGQQAAESSGSIAMGVAAGCAIGGPVIGIAASKIATKVARYAECEEEDIEDIKQDIEL